MAIDFCLPFFGGGCGPLSTFSHLMLIRILIYHLSREENHHEFPVASKPGDFLSDCFDLRGLSEGRGRAGTEPPTRP